MTTIMVAVIARTPILSQGLTSMFRDYGLTVVGADGVPDVLVVAEPNAAVWRRLVGSSAQPAVPTVVIEPAVAVDAAWTGAAALLANDSPADTIVAAIRLVAAGHVVVPRHAPPQAVPDGTVIDPEDVHIAVRLAQGLSVTDIADDLGYSTRTMHRRLGHLYRRLDATNRSQAITRAVLLGMVEGPHRGRHGPS